MLAFGQGLDEAARDWIAEALVFHLKFAELFVGEYAYPALRQNHRHAAGCVLNMHAAARIPFEQGAAIIHIHGWVLVFELA